MWGGCVSTRAPVCCTDAVSCGLRGGASTKGGCHCQGRRSANVRSHGLPSRVGTYHGVAPYVGMCVCADAQDKARLATEKLEDVTRAKGAAEGAVEAALAKQPSAALQKHSSAALTKELSTSIKRGLSIEAKKSIVGSVAVGAGNVKRWLRCSACVCKFDLFSETI